MKKSALLAILFACTLPAAAQNWTTVTAANITDLNQQKLAAGQLCFLATDQNDNPISIGIGGGGQLLKRQFCSAVANGAVTAFSVPNPAQTTPAGIYYRVFARDSSTGQEVLRYTQVTFNGTSFNFDLYAPLNQGQFSAPGGNAVSGNLSVNGNITATGSVVAANIPASIPGAGSCTNQFVTALSVGAAPTCSATANNLVANQGANAATALAGSRATDTSPTGNFLSFKSAAGASLWQVDVTGTLTAGAVPTANLTGTLPAANLSGTLAAAQFPALTGDVSNAAGSLATTVGKVNGVSYQSAPATHTVPVITAANTETYKTVPDCQDSSGNHLNYTQSTDSFSCGTTISPITVTTTGTQTLTNKTLASPTISGTVPSYNGISTVGNGFSSIVAQVDTTGLTTNVATATLYAVPVSGSGLYRVSAYTKLSTAGSTSSTMPTVNIFFTDADDSIGPLDMPCTPNVTTPSATSMGQSGGTQNNTTNLVLSGVCMVNAKASTNIQYNTSGYASSAAGMTYTLHIKLEKL